MLLLSTYEYKTFVPSSGLFCRWGRTSLAHTVLVFVLFVMCPPSASSQTVWFKYVGNPVMNVGPAGSWDDGGVCIFRVLRDNTSYRAWYSGNDGTNRRMGYAASRDGIKWVKRTEPVLDLGPDGTWDWREATKGYVLFSDSKYHMWYHGYDGSLWRIGHAQSEDGIVWKKSNSVNPVLTVGPAPWDRHGVGFPCVLREAGGGYKMWYSGYYSPTGPGEIGYAYAEDPVSWKKHSTPVLTRGDPGSWDDGTLLFPNILFNGDLYEMWYGGSRGVFSTSRTGHATSPDGIHWTKDPHNPVLTPGMPGSWDAQATYVGDVSFDGSLYRMWYGGFDGVTERTGLAVSPKGAEVKVSANRIYVRPGLDTVLVSVRVANPYGLLFTANFRSPNGQTVGTVDLFDDGLHGDGLAGDGLFANRWLPSEEKQYCVDVELRLQGKQNLTFKLEDAAEFTGVGPVRVAGYELLNGKSPGPGDTVFMKLDLRNQGTVAPAESVSAFMSTTDRWITSSEPEKEAYGTIAHGDNAGSNGYYRFFISPNCPPGEEIRFLVAISSAGFPLWQDAVVLRVATPWWQTNWAYALYGFFAIGLFYVVRRFETGRIRRKHEKEMERFQAEQLKKLDQLKSRFFANISHEFRTPLTLIRGPVEQMLSGEYKGDVKSQYEMILRNSNRLERLVNQLLDLSRLESGQMRIHAESLDIAKFVCGAAAAFESLAKRKGIEFRIECPGGPVIGWFDRDAVEQIVTNLLSNAFKFTSKGGCVTVIVSCRGGSRSAPLDLPDVEIAVSDTGIGIPAHEIDKVFDRFYQVDQSQTREYEGTGIGLALTKELVELHKGEIKVESRVGQGTTFTVRLPLGREHFTDEEIVEHPQPDTGFPKPYPHHLVSSTPNPTFSGGALVKPEPDESLPLILIIEDNADMREYIRSHVDGRYRLSEAVDGEEGVRNAIEAIPDLIISDVMMPKMDGFEVCRRVKTDQRTSHIPLILLTAKATAENKVEGLETGADDYLTKPFDAKELLVRMKNLIDQRRVLREKFQRELVFQPKDVTIQSMDATFLTKAIAIVESHLSDPRFDTAAFAEEAGMSRMQLHRKLRALTNLGPGELIRSFRMKRAASLLQQKSGNISEIAYEVGYNNPSYFAQVFREFFGVPPSEYPVRQETHQQ